MSAQGRIVLGSMGSGTRTGAETPRAAATPRPGASEASSESRPRVAPAAQFLDASRDEIRRRVSQLTTLYQIGRAISESRNWTEALDYFLVTLCDYLDVRGAGILLYSCEASVLAPRRVLSIPEPDVRACSQSLLAAFATQQPNGEIHALECYVRDRGVVCSGHAERWRFTVLPLLYRRAPLGFLVLDKEEWQGPSFAAQLFFLQTIQTLLTEEVANAVHLSRLLDLKNFNEAVLESIESGVLTANEQGEIHFANRLARRTLGLRETQETLPALLLDSLFQIGAAGAGALASILALAEGRGSFEGLLHRRDGRRVPVTVRTSRIVNPSDSQPLLLVAFEDRSEQHLLEEQLRRADRLRSLGELSAAIAHEVRNPLQGISLTLSNLRPYLKPGAEPYVDVMFQEMDRLDSIVGNILSFARPAPPQPRPVSLLEVLSRAVELAAERASLRQVTLAVETRIDDPVCEVDEGQILQVVLNLVMNAIDASPPAGRVRLRLRSVEQPLVPQRVATAGHCRIEVCDQGLGVAEDVRHKLFDPFFTTKPEGTGLGLAVSQKIVEEHHGVIHVERDSDDETIFVVEIPRRFVAAYETVTPRARTREDASGCG